MAKTEKLKGIVLNGDAEEDYDSITDSEPGKNTKTEIVLNPFKLYIKR